eukprot:4690109-Lingulodinium_polyedra.AAC.1
MEDRIHIARGWAWRAARRSLRHPPAPAASGTGQHLLHRRAAQVEVEANHLSQTPSSCPRSN